MKKLVELDAAVSALDDLPMDYGRWDVDDVLHALASVPTVDAVPVRHGHWVRHDYADIVDGHYVPNYECSVCHAWKQDDSDYCPDCGALNDGNDGDNG